jgi:hypothetical protein
MYCHLRPGAHRSSLLNLGELSRIACRIDGLLISYSDVKVVSVCGRPIGDIASGGRSGLHQIEVKFPCVS